MSVFPVLQTTSLLNTYPKKLSYLAVTHSPTKPTITPPTHTHTKLHHPFCKMSHKIKLKLSANYSNSKIIIIQLKQQILTNTLCKN